MAEENKMSGLIIGLVALLCTAAFFILGFATGSWAWIWLVFLVIPITAIIVNLVSEKKDIAGAVVGLVALLCVGIFMILGFVFGWWHPGWIIFLAIPLTSMIADLIKNKGKSDVLVGLVAVLAAVVFLILGFSMGIWHVAWLVFLLIPITAIIRNMIRVATGKDVPENKGENA